MPLVAQQGVRRTLTAESVPDLDAMAQRLFEEARASHHRLRLDRRLFIATGSTVHLFAWKGDRATHTPLMQLRGLGFDAGSAQGVITISDVEYSALAACLRKFAEAGQEDAIQLATTVLNKKCKKREKYDRLLSEELLCEEYARRAFDPDGAWQATRDIVTAGL